MLKSYRITNYFDLYSTLMTTNVPQQLTGRSFCCGWKMLHLLGAALFLFCLLQQFLKVFKDIFEKIQAVSKTFYSSVNFFIIKIRLLNYTFLFHVH